MNLYNILTLNKISSKGLDLFSKDKYNVGDNIENPDAIILRSFSMHEMELPETLKAVARAGAGVNNIPIEKCSEKGIVVFNTPGANANAVKELTIAALFLASRKIVQGIQWAKTLAGQGDAVPKLVEKGKSNFAGPEIEGKKLGVIGLGAIGVMVANAAHSLGMEVEGYDPYISVDSAWGLSRSIKKATDINSLLETSDYITLHVPLTPDTKNMIDAEQFAKMKKGVRLLNFSRGELVNNQALISAINDQIVAAYVTDFACDELLNIEQVICIPHLGASTPESEENCAVMAVKEVMDFLENGHIKNSVNFPDCELVRSADYRITIAHKNIPNMVGQMSTGLANSGINIANMLNKSKKDMAYTIIDTEEPLPEEIVNKIKSIDGVLNVRVL